MSDESEARIWTRGGFVADRFGAASGAVFMSPEEATGRLGSGTASVLVLEPGDEAMAVAGRIHEFDAVFVAFPVFSDGRGFSAARLLREKLRFSGEIRAVGHFLLDQIPLMLRVGFTSFAVTHAPTIRRLEAGRIPGIPLYLQPALGDEVEAGRRAWARRSAG